MLRRESVVLTVIDVQERLLPSIHEAQRVVLQGVRLVRGFHILGAPILTTEQYRKGIGPTDVRLIDSLLRSASADEPLPGPIDLSAEPPPPPAEFRPIEKMHYSCALHPPFMEALEATGRRQVLLCGIESHVCVLQTALHLRERDYEVFLCADAVSSRHPRNVEIALRRMEQAGVQLTTVEMAMFEMLEISGTPEFKRWSRLIRQP